jgi:ATP-dependent Clp protease ATP-binding subunit ClpC
LAEHHCVTIAEEALQAAASLAARYVPDRRLPDKAIDALDKACARVEIAALSVSPDEPAPRVAGGVVTAEAVAEVISEWTGIPVAQLTEDERARLLGMAEALKARIVGQDEAVAAVAQAIQRARAGLRDAGRPIGVLLFLGPTGVGKTELAKATAEFLFGSDRALTRLDMSEYQEKHTVSRLVGAPPGYVGHDEEGQLTGALRRRPFCVVLLDEIDKAHPDVLNLFLPVFDDGRLTDARGRTVDATNALFILTSNFGFSRPMGFRPHDSEADRQALLAEAKNALRPELLNRIDQTTLFRPLQDAHIAAIARLLLRSLGQRLTEQGLGLEVSDAAVALLGRLGYDPQYGARPLRRAIEQHVENPLGGMLLRGEARAGHIVLVDAPQDEITIDLMGIATP